MHRDEHLYEMIPGREEIVGLIEQAVAQSRTHQHGNKDVDKQRLELLVGDMLLLIESLHEQVAQNQTDHPAYGIPTNAKMSHVEHDLVRVPDNIRE